jgi:SpoVK/Ycf46/Vps4 family AAA+-type ATPase
MAGSELVQELIRSHVSGDWRRFRAIALQLAASEARAGHRVVAGRIRDLIEEADKSPPPDQPPTPLARPPAELRGVLDTSYPKASLRDIVLEEEPAAAVKKVLREHRSREALQQWGLTPRRKLLLYGPPGCGKTLLASVLAGELGLPLVRVRVEVLFSRYLGETAALLTDIFEEMKRVRGVFLFDEFDAIGRQRRDSNDIGEAKRVVSTFLQLLDVESSESLIVAATNVMEQLDDALFRRFSDVIHLPAPGVEQLTALLRLRTTGHPLPDSAIVRLARLAEGLTYADLSKAVEDGLKAMVLARRDRLAPADVEAGVREMQARHRMEA